MEVFPVILLLTITASVWAEIPQDATKADSRNDVKPAESPLKDGHRGNGTRSKFNANEYKLLEKFVPENDRDAVPVKKTNNFNSSVDTSVRGEETPDKGSPRRLLVHNAVKSSLSSGEALATSIKDLRQAPSPLFQLPAGFSLGQTSTAAAAAPAAAAAAVPGAPPPPASIAQAAAPQPSGALAPSNTSPFSILSSLIPFPWMNSVLQMVLPGGQTAAQTMPAVPAVKSMEGIVLFLVELFIKHFVIGAVKRIISFFFSLFKFF